MERASLLHPSLAYCFSALEKAGSLQRSLGDRILASDGASGSNQALAAWVGEEEERHRLTLEGMADVTARRDVDQADVEAWAASLSTGNPLPLSQQ